MDNFITRALVVLGSIITWLTLAVAVLAVVAVQLEPFTGDPTIARVVGFITAAMLALRVLIEIISRITQVLPNARGLLPPADEELPYTVREAALKRQLAAIRAEHP